MYYKIIIKVCDGNCLECDPTKLCTECLEGYARSSVDDKKCSLCIL